MYRKWVTSAEQEANEYLDEDYEPKESLEERRKREEAEHWEHYNGTCGY